MEYTEKLNLVDQYSLESLLGDDSIKMMNDSLKEKYKSFD